ncbi:hypothetical protein H257_05560 [Aphanomyces astaci]|uniref:Uncharacterized protein n=1 Tax=Aphanomyces astaci TaxID=112090 RepID=W4GT15_APHAT|nr:hypothetical protein H257_05560 [Aphanomyces astaci]ETV82033.1 hypothetical protein H257_05560 [Aphanomyces astaci]|eukprot:XP_009828770.1 hypothetical protein H257_05560 [Aphanomyces astaci]
MLGPQRPPWPPSTYFAELAAQDAASHLAMSTHRAEVQAAHTDGHFDMTALVNAMRVDTLCGHLSSHLVKFACNVWSFDRLYTRQDGDELCLSRFDIELVLAIAEVLLAVHGPLFFNSEAVLLATTGTPVGVIASHALDDDMRRFLSTLRRVPLTLHDMYGLGQCDLTTLGQVQVHESTLAS